MTCKSKGFCLVFTVKSCLDFSLLFDSFFSPSSSFFPCCFLLLHSVFFLFYPPPFFPLLPPLSIPTPWVMFATQFGKCNSILIIINIYHVCEHVFLVLLICPVNKCLQQPGPQGPLGLQGHHTHLYTHTQKHTCSQLQEVACCLLLAWRLHLSVYTHSHMHFIGGWNGSGLLSTNDTSIHQPCCIDATHKHKNAHSLSPF